jgi:glycosyltransferase involved in cell wall biosynthesis
VTVTAVIPLYQHAGQVGRALASVLRQTRPPDEILVVDDGSTDGGGEAARAVAGPLATVIRRDHAGEGAARNHGVARASSDWVAFLDADDEWRPEFIARTAAVAERRPGLTAVFSNLRLADRDRPLLRRPPATETVPDYFALLLANAGGGMSSSSVLVERRTLLDCGGFPEGVRVGADLDTWARLAWSGPVAGLAECLAVCHADAEERATLRARAHAPEPPAFLRTYRAWCETGRIPEPLRQSSARFANRVLAEHAMELAHAGRGDDAAALLRAEWEPGGPRRLYAKARLWSCLPSGVLRRMRAVRAGLRSVHTGGAAGA